MTTARRVRIEGFGAVAGSERVGRVHPTRDTFATSRRRC